jgi:hypothetical protein
MVSMTSQLSHYHTLLVFLSERDLEMKSLPFMILPIVFNNKFKLDDRSLSMMS